MSRPLYHSGWGKPETEAKPLDYWACPSGVAFVHDLVLNDLPSEYDRCDVLYTDPPSRQGFDAFNRKAGVQDGRTFIDYTKAVSKVIDTFRIPAVVVTGPQVAHYLPDPRLIEQIRMNGEHTLALVYGEVGDTGGWSTNLDLLDHLASRFNCVGDFCCGYGSAARAFHQAGRRFVVSDINPRCIGEVAASIGVHADPA